MRAPTPFLALVVAGAAVTLPAQSKVSSRILDNGLHVLVASNPAAAFVTVEMVFRAGANVQHSAKDAGMAHLLEHMLFRRGESGSIETDLGKIDAYMNGSTDDETVRYYFTFPPKHLGDGIDIMARMVRRPSWAKGALDDERRIVQGELERRASEPDFHLETESNAAVWGENAWSSRSPGGNVVTVQGATMEQVKAIYDRYYVPNNAALVVAGPVTDTDVHAFATKAFGNWRKGDDPFAAGLPPAIKPLAGIHRKVITGDVKDVTFLVRWHGPSTRTQLKDTHAADVFAGLVNQPVSRAKRRLVDAGIVDDLSFGYSTSRDIGAVSLRVRTSEDRAAQAARLLGEEIAALARGDFFTEEDLGLAKKWQRVASHFRTETAASTASWLSEFWSTAGPGYFEGYEEALQAQTAEDVKRFGQAYITGKPYSVVVMIPRFSPPALKASVEQAITRWGAAR